MNVDVRLYLVTDPGVSDIEDVVVSAVTGGVTCVQVRDKHASTAERIDVARRLRAALPDSVAVLANDDLGAARVCDGLHVGVTDIEPATARGHLGPDAIIGWSINHASQLDNEVQLAACDYVAASPVWDTPTKSDVTAPWGLDGVGDLGRRLAGRMPLVGIGGIHAGNAAELIRAGAQGVAVVSAICGADDPAEAASALRAAVERGLIDGEVAR